MWIDDEVFTGFQIKRQLCSSVELEVNQSNKLLTWFWSYICGDNLAVGLNLCVPAHWKQRNVGSLPSQVAVNSRWKANGWICSVISAFRLPPDSWNVRDDKRRLHHPHSAKQAYLIHMTHNTHTQCIENQAHISLIVPRCKYSQLNRFILLEPAALP